MKNLLSLLFPINTVYAHCDIPCGIYDPHTAQMAAHSVIRMTKMIEELNFDTEDQAEIRKSHQQITRLVRVKEEHAELVKHEVRVIWGDFFKEEHLKNNPKLHELVFNIMKLASKARQEISIEISEDLLAKVQEFSEIFFAVKGVKAKRVKSFYPTEGELVVPE